MPVGIPPNTLGTNIGTVDARGNFTPASGAQPFDASNGIINCYNPTSTSVWVKLEYEYDDEGTTQTTNQIGHIHEGACFLVVDVSSSTTVNVYTSMTPAGDTIAPASSDWTSQGTVTVTGASLRVTPSITITGGGGTVSMPVAVVPASSTLEVTNESTDRVTLWVNDYESGSATYNFDPSPTPSQQVSIRAKWQWTIAYEDDGDPQIVLKRPPNDIAS